MRQVRIIRTVYESGAAKYLAGQSYPATEDTLRQVALRNGDEVDVPTAADPAEAEPPAQAVAVSPEHPQDEAKAAAPAAPVVARKRAA